MSAMDKLSVYALRAYMTFRNPKFFLVILVAYISGSLFAHCSIGYDADFGLTNLILSIEASTASAVLMMVTERTAALQEQMAQVQREQLSAILEHSIEQRKLMERLIAIVESSRVTDQAILEYIKSR